MKIEDEAARLRREHVEAAKVWQEGFATGKSRAMRHMSDEPGLSLDVPNPYEKEDVNADAAP